ncbi:MAG: rhomboid family intramembrane serine protease [Thermoplasmata archaeon]
MPVFYAIIKKANIALALILANLLVFVIEILTDRFMKEAYWDLMFTFAFPQYRIGITWSYQVFTHAFLHGSIYHILGNMLVLFFVGIPLEERIGIKKFMIVYFVSMVFAVLFDTMFYFGRLSYALGASGAVSGVLGAMLILYPRVEIPMFLGPIFLMRVKAWIAILFFFCVETMLSFFSLMGMESGVAHLAHVGGFIAGMVIAIFTGKGADVKRERAMIDLEKLAVIAKTPAQHRALENLKSEEMNEVSDAWLQYFASHTECPGCRRKMKYGNGALVCTCGKVIEITKPVSKKLK